jgi:hypothetical protein
MKSHLPHIKHHLPQMKSHMPHIKHHMPQMKSHLPHIKHHMPQMKSHLPHIRLHSSRMKSPLSQIKLDFPRDNAHKIPNPGSLYPKRRHKTQMPQCVKQQSHYTSGSRNTQQLFHAIKKHPNTPQSKPRSQYIYESQELFRMSVAHELLVPTIRSAYTSLIMRGQSQHFCAQRVVMPLKHSVDILQPVRQ